MKGEGESPRERFAGLEGVLALNYTGTEVVWGRCRSGGWRVWRDVWMLNCWCEVSGAKLNLEKMEVVAARTRETADKNRWSVRLLCG
jgi:hypothetical protein